MISLRVGLFRYKMSDVDKNIWALIYDQGPEDCSLFRKNWYDVWSNHNSDVIYATFTDEKQQSVIFPYFIKRLGPFNFASLAGNYFPRKGLPYSSVSDELVDKFSRYLGALIDISGCQLGPVKKGDPFIQKLVEKLSKDNWKLILKSTGFDYGMTVPESVEDYMSSISKNRRKKTAYYLRRLEKTGVVDIRYHKSLNRHKWQQVFADLEAVESKAWVSESGDPHFIGTVRQSYWNELISDEWYREAFNAWVIYLDENPISYVAAIDVGSERFVLSSSFNKEYSDFRTGSILEIELMRMTIEQEKVTFINNGMGDSGYKGAWGNKEFQELYEIVAFPPTMKGRFAYLVAGLKTKLGR